MDLMRRVPFNQFPLLSNQSNTLLMTSARLTVFLLLKGIQYLTCAIRANLLPNEYTREMWLFEGMRANKKKVLVALPEFTKASRTSQASPCDLGAYLCFFPLRSPNNVKCERPSRIHMV